MNRLYRSTDDRIIAGVAGGLAKYFNIDTVLIRLLWVFAVLLGGTGVIAYIIAWLIIPEAPAGVGSGATEQTVVTGAGDTGESLPEKDPGKKGEKSRNTGLLLVGVGLFFLARQFVPYTIYRFSWPALLILLGFVFLIRGRKE